MANIVDRIISKIPYELHIPSHQFCGPNTKLRERLAAGQRGINQLDSACMFHDIAYAESKDPVKRRKADLKLIRYAKSRITAPDSNLKERIASVIVSTLLGGKVAIGMGMKRKRKNNKKRKPKIGGYLNPAAIIAGIGAASNILQTGTNLYKNYKVIRQNKRILDELRKKRKVGSGLAHKKKKRPKKTTRKKGSGLRAGGGKKKKKTGSGYFLKPYNKRNQDKRS